MKKRLLIIMLVSLMLIAGCNEDKNITGDLIDVKVAEFRGLTWAPLYAAYQNGFYKDEGLNVELLKIDEGPNAFKSMHAGQADFCILSQEVALQAQEKGLESKLIAAMLDTRYYAFVLGPGINKIEDLKGENVYASAPGTAPYTFTLSVLKDGGLLPDKDINLIQMDGSGVLAGLESGEIKGAFVNMDNYAAVDKLEGVTYLVDTRRKEDSKKYLKSDDFPAEIITVTKEFNDKNPEIVQRFVNGTVRGIEWMLDNSSESCAELIEPLFPGMDIKLLAEKIHILKQALNTKQGYISKEGQKAVEDMAIRGGVISKNFNYEDFVDMSYIEEYRK